MNDSAQVFTVTLLGADGARVSFAARRGRAIVKSAADAGIILTTGCLQGRCAICRARLLDGQLDVLRARSKHATASPLERRDGCVLPCSLGPLSDVVLEPLSPWIEQRTAARSGHETRR